jgi:hypothetical protein
VFEGAFLMQYFCKGNVLNENSKNTDRAKERKALMQLRQHIELSFSNYRNDVLRMASKEKIFDTASEILAVKEIFMELYLWIEISIYSPKCTWPRTNMTIEEAEYLLSLKNPLKSLAKKWWFCFIGSDNCGVFLDDIRGDWVDGSAEVDDYAKT